MNCCSLKKIILVSVIIVVVIIFSFYCVSSYYNEEHYDNNNLMPLWHNQATDEFFNRFERPIDQVHMAYYKKSTNHLANNKAVQFIKNDLGKYHKEVEMGKAKAKDSTIVIAGLLQNGAYQIPELKDRCKQIIRHFKDYRIVILENNSIDSSRDDLLDWARFNDRIKILCQDPFVTNSDECQIEGSSGAKDSSPMPNRIRKMATLRNIYMDHIKHYYKDFNYLCVMDMDLEGDLFIDGFFHALGLINPKIDGVACNGVITTEDSFYYYDSFAYVEEHDTPYMNDIAQKSEHDNYVHINMTQLYSSQMVPDRVQSAFGGCAVYSLPSVVNNRYDFSPNAFMCEHTYFHQGKKIYVDPRMIFLITKNG